MGCAGGAARSGETEGHRSLQLHTITHERADAELQCSSCCAAGIMHECIRICVAHGTQIPFFSPFLQVEFHPQLCQAELRSVCKEYGVCFQAYSSLGKGELLNDPVVVEVAKNCVRSPAQVNILALP